MRFTKIPLIATLMAVALSLLIVLPTIAQTSDITDGELSSGDIAVGVFDNIADAQLAKLVRSTDPNLPSDHNVYIAGTPPFSPITGLGTAGSISATDPAYMANNETSPQDTFFRSTLYVSNQESAYNTVLINVTHDPVLTGTGNCVEDVTGTDADESAAALVTATVRNNRSTDETTLELVVDSGRANSQGFFRVVPDDGENEASNGPDFCVDDTVDTDDTQTGVQPGTNATEADDSAIAQIPAKHGDRLTVTTSGVAGQIELVVDGEGPEFTAITPDDNAVTRPSRLTFSFEVRDDDSGLRHDGESVISPDGDRQAVNPDGDQHLASEPLSEDPDTQVPANGAAMDIKVNVVANDLNADTAAPTDDISASGTWRMAGSRAGVAYAFSASGADRGDGDYLYQLTATDRAGNTRKTDAVTRTEDEDEPFVFRVDDEEPSLNDNGVRTGISWDSAKDRETVDRSYVALEFGEDALGDVDMDNITVVGHTIVSVIHPNVAPAINRGAALESGPAGGVAPPDPDDGGTEGSMDPGTPVKPDADSIDADDRIPLTDIGAGLTFVSTFVDTEDGDPTTPKPLRPTDGDNDGNPDFNAIPDGVDCENASDGDAAATPPVAETTPNATTCAAFVAWMKYEAALSAKRVYDDELETFQEFTQYMRENPGTDIEGNTIREPRSRVYIELSEDLAADAEPDVVVVGGAVFDLAGNTNDAKTVQATDWIAPSLTVTVTGTANDRPVVNDDGSFTVDVRSDEDLNRRPVVFFVEIKATPKYDNSTPPKLTGYDYEIQMVGQASPLTQQEDENHWGKTYKRSNINSDLGTGLIGVVVLGEDGEDNSGATAGWSPSKHQNAPNPTAGNSLNIDKLDGADLLVEIDEQFNNGNQDDENNDVTGKIGEVTPRSGGKADTTESANPFVKLSFDYEAKEYDKGAKKDSHDTVDVTEITLNGDNAMENLNRVNATSFSLITRDLAVGKYTVEYTAEDDAGNEYEGEFVFNVEERKPYEIDVQPGWNLISLPATPVEPAIDMVLASNQYISPVLGYQQGDWITAIREDDGTWRGRLTEITGGYGYWVHARTFESISAMLAEVDPAGILPTVPVTAGWNLLGVLDIFQGAMNTAPGGDDDADNYFSSIDWKVAYTYDTRQSLWSKTTPGVEGAMEVLNGKGYWVWSPAPNTLVP